MKYVLTMLNMLLRFSIAATTRAAVTDSLITALKKRPDDPGLKLDVGLAFLKSEKRTGTQIEIIILG